MATTSPQVAASPPPNKGHCIIRDRTRRRNADSLLKCDETPTTAGAEGTVRPEGTAAVPVGGGGAWLQHPGVMADTPTRNLARNFPWSVLISPTNVAIPTMPIQSLKGLHGNYVRHFWGTMPRSGRSRQPKARPPRASRRPPRTPGTKHPNNAHFHRSGLHFEHASQKSHVISLGQFSTGATNVAIATTVFQNLKG